MRTTFLLFAFLIPVTCLGINNWTYTAGSVNSDNGWQVTHDALGNIYMAGYSSGDIDFDPGPGIDTIVHVGYTDVLVMKLSPQGNVIWVKGVGSNGEDEAYGIALDDSCNVYLTGNYSQTTDFDPGPAVSLVYGEGVFVMKLDSSGNYKWAKGFNGADWGRAITTDQAHNVYVTGYFDQTCDFNPAPGVYYNLTSIGFQDIFIAKLDMNGNFSWAKNIGSSGGVNASGYAIAFDNTNNLYVAGTKDNQTDFDPGAAVLTVSGACFLAKYSTAGALKWVKGIKTLSMTNLRITNSNNIYFGGRFTNTADFDPGAGIYNLTSAGSSDGYICKLDTSGAFVQAKNIGGTGSDYVKFVTVDASENMYLTGYFSGTADLDPGPGNFNMTSNGPRDSYVAKFSPAGDFVWAVQMGGSSQDEGNGLSVDYIGNLIATGQFRGTADFDLGPGTDTRTAVGLDDFYIKRVVGNYPLPIEVLNFSAQKQNAAEVLISWNFGKMKETGKYAIETSADLISWTAIYSEEIADPQSQQIASGYVHRDPRTGNNYYRLAATDRDQQIFYSAVVKVFFDKATLITLYPNPASGTISLSGLKNATKACILDVNGIRIIDINLSDPAQIDVSALPSGNYILSVLFKDQSTRCLRFSK